MAVSFVRIGLTGNIGSGKSEVAAIFKSFGIPVMNLDDIGREVTLRPQVLGEIRSLFGPSVFQGATLNRKALQQMIFGDSDMRKALERVLHPLIWAEFEKWARELRDSGKRLVVCEAALLFEAGLGLLLDGVVVVTAHETIRRDRLFVRDGMSAETFSKVEVSQMNESEKLKRASFIIDNSGSIETLRPQVFSLTGRWKSDGYLD